MLSNKSLDDSYDLLNFVVVVACAFASLIYIYQKSLVQYMIQDCLCVRKCKEFLTSLVLGDFGWFGLKTFESECNVASRGFTNGV